ncbi:uncharacterized protein isoform X1 [Danio rerio]|uniref:Uncharacterized protein isoform X1 n=1 Tax=Danio rerio TaxID=7955 RepID=A0AC58IEM2_DANRE
MAKNGFPLLFAVISLLKQGMPNGGTDKVTAPVMEGDSVTLHTGVETNVLCNNGTERFTNRLKLDNQTGSLTITNIRNTDAGIYNHDIFKIPTRENSFVGDVHYVGEYKLVIISPSSRVSIHRSFRFNINEQDVKTAASVGASNCKREISVSVILSVLVTVALIVGGKYGLSWMLKKRQKYGLAIALKKEGQSVILDNDIEIETDDHLQWLFGEVTLFDEGNDEQLISRLSLDQTGSLTINDLRTTDSGYYKLLINKGGKTTSKRFKLIVSGCTEEEPEPDEIKDPLKLSKS